MKTAESAGGVTFTVSDVERATKPLPEIPYQEAAARLVRESTQRPMESWSQNSGKLLQAGSDNNFVIALNLAYNDHRPVALSPDMIWLVLLQGVALHVYAHSEALRSRFVAHEGKQILQVRHDEFRLGFVGNDWESVFHEFSDQIQTHIGATNHALLVPSFSTTGVVEKAAFEVTLMDTVQPYFIYAVNTLCGIPAITLEGTPEDWEQLRERAAELERFDLDWWMPHLLPVLDQFVMASRGKADKAFWQSFYKYSRMSGTATMSGAVLNLFPYLGRKRPGDDELLADWQQFLRGASNPAYQGEAGAIKIAERVEEMRERLKTRQPLRDELRRNPALGSAEPRIDTDEVPNGFALAPFVWNYYGTPYAMELLAGFVGVRQDCKTLALRPEIGWAVRSAV